MKTKTKANGQATKLKAWRKLHRLSQSKAAARLGVKTRTLQAWEIGYRQPNKWLWQDVSERMKQPIE